MRPWQALAGSLRVVVTGRAPERFVNLCVQEGILLWDVRAEGSGLALSVPLRALPRLRALRRRARVRLRIVGRHGLPFALRRLRRLRVALTLLFLMCTLLYALSQFVWFFEVRGATRTDPGEILRVARELGLRPGVLRAAVDRNRVARDLVLRLPGLSWAALQFFGAKAIIEVAEKELPPPAAPAEPGDIVARRPGVIEHVIVLEGEPAVARGQTVREGEVLIYGRRAAQPPSGDGPPPAAVAVHARGRVLARTWYSAYAEVERVERVAVKTGRTAGEVLLRVRGRSLHLLGAWGSPFATFERKEDVLARFRARGAASWLEVVRVRYDEVALHEVQLSREEAIARAEARLKAHVLGQIGPGARIAGVHSRVVLDTGERVGVRLTVEAVEDIGAFRPAGGGEAVPPPGDVLPPGPPDGPPGEPGP